jgi:hypothetical protein
VNRTVAHCPEGVAKRGETPGAAPGRDPWIYVESGATDPAENMAFDEALLESVEALGQPVLRSYGWTEPAATFGYFQRHQEVAALTPLRPLIRRPTGGGLVPHAADWTYGVAVPPGHAWYGLRAPESYARMHAWLRDAFERLGIVTRLAPCCQVTGPGQCFVGWELSDLLRGDAKLGGAAQRRNRLGLLIQGSLQPVPEGLARATFFAALKTVATEQWGAIWETRTGAAWSDRVRELAETKYRQAAYRDRR